jgi:hypothetical protein
MCGPFDCFWVATLLEHMHGPAIATAFKVTCVLPVLLFLLQASHLPLPCPVLMDEGHVADPGPGVNTTGKQ